VHVSDSETDTPVRLTHQVQDRLESGTRSRGERVHVACRRPVGGKRVVGSEACTEVGEGVGTTLIVHDGADLAGDDNEHDTLPGGNPNGLILLAPSRSPARPADNLTR
jgi:hypothetical protein